MQYDATYRRVQQHSLTFFSPYFCFSFSSPFCFLLLLLLPYFTNTPTQTFTKLPAELTPEEGSTVIRDALEQDGMTLEEKEVFENFTFQEESLLGRS